MANKYLEALKAIGIGGLLAGGLSFVLAVVTVASNRNGWGLGLIGIFAWLGALGVGVGIVGIFLWLHAAAVTTGQAQLAGALRERPRTAASPEPVTWPVAPSPAVPAALESTPPPATDATPGATAAAPDWATLATALGELDGRGVPAALVADPRAAVEELLRRLGRNGVSIPRELAGQLNALDPHVLAVLARARVSPLSDG